jgi:hypothetical protein
VLPEAAQCQEMKISSLERERHIRSHATTTVYSTPVPDFFEQLLFVVALKIGAE